MASEQEEIVYGQMLLNENVQEGKMMNYREKKELETKVLRKKLVYERYVNYIENEIDREHLAPIKAVWIDRIINAMTIFSRIRPFQKQLP